jgi:hypothetical protein
VLAPGALTTREWAKTGNYHPVDMYHDEVRPEFQESMLKTSNDIWFIRLIFSGPNGRLHCSSFSFSNSCLTRKNKIKVWSTRTSLYRPITSSHQIPERLFMDSIRLLMQCNAM